MPSTIPVPKAYVMNADGIPAILGMTYLLTVDDLASNRKAAEQNIIIIAIPV